MGLSATSAKRIGTSISAQIRSSVPSASASSVAVTPPSTEFSIGTTAEAARPSRTAARAAGTEATGR